MVWARLGFVRWPLSLCLLMVVVFTLIAVATLARSGGARSIKTKIWIDAVGVWGFLAFLSGLLGASVGLIRALQGAERAGTMASAEAAAGLVMATVSPSLGTAVFAVAVLVWFLLQLRWRLAGADAAVGADRGEGPSRPGGGVVSA